MCVCSATCLVARRSSPSRAFSQEYELSPIEVAIAEMTQKTRDLLDVVERKPTDVKKLQLRLQVRRRRGSTLKTAICLMISVFT